MIQLTQSAVKELKKIMQEQEMSPENYFVRLGILGGGCSGFSYSFNLDETYNEEKDTLLEQNGLKIVVDKRSGLYLEGTTVDWVEDLNRRGFAFNNPNAVRTCGCAKSFSV